VSRVLIPDGKNWSVAIFRGTRNGVHPISGTKNWATTLTFGGPRSFCICPGAHSARRYRPSLPVLLL